MYMHICVCIYMYIYTLIEKLHNWYSTAFFLYTRNVHTIHNL